jgi:hypothetical protein
MSGTSRAQIVGQGSSQPTARPRPNRRSRASHRAQSAATERRSSPLTGERRTARQVCSRAASTSGIWQVWLRREPALLWDARRGRPYLQLPMATGPAAPPRAHRSCVAPRRRTVTRVLDNGHLEPAPATTAREVLAYAAGARIRIPALACWPDDNGGVPVTDRWRTGEQGIGAFDAWCVARRWPMVRVPTERDIGIDGFVQVTDDEGKPTGDVLPRCRRRR